MCRVPRFGSNCTKASVSEELAIGVLGVPVAAGRLRKVVVLSLPFWVIVEIASALLVQRRLRGRAAVIKALRRFTRAEQGLDLWDEDEGN